MQLPKNNLGVSRFPLMISTRPSLPKRKRRTPVTIIVGIICEQSIVLASDSQTTAGTAKRWDSRKIRVVKFKNAPVLVADSGCADTASRAIEIFSDLGKEVEITDHRTVADTADKAIRTLVDELRFAQGDCTMEELREFVLREELGCELMIAHLFEKKPYLYRIQSWVGFANRVTTDWEAVGCAANLGGQILTEYLKPGLHFGQVTAIAILAVETAKKHDAYCGGPTRVGILSRAYEDGDVEYDHAWIMPEDEVLDIVDVIQTELKPHRQKLLAALLMSLGKRTAKRIENMYNASSRGTLMSVDIKEES